jgi:inner membrane transporter RhtA
MSLEPAFALLIGFIALHQTPNLLATLGVGLVVAAGVGAERTGDRTPTSPIGQPEDSKPTPIAA